jgi:predicted ester cyclase
VERGGIGYVRQNFWSLREFTDLHDVNRQARQWLAEVANQRLHHETRQRPIDRFRADALRPLPAIPYDYRDAARLWSTKISVCSSMATATASRIALSAAGSR